MHFKFLFLIALFFTVSSSWSQNDINQLDDQGNRHGLWEKYFEKSRQLRYQGTFNHGKETGIFKFYCSDCKDQPMVIKTFSEENDSTFVQYFAKKGKLASQGAMIGKNRVGEWLYFQKRNRHIMSKEFYVNGKLEGIKYTYYKNKKIAEEVEYRNGIKEGKHNYYSFTGVLLKELVNQNDQLHGTAKYYDAKGELIIQGIYKNGLKDGVWKYYKNGKLLKEEIFPKPRR